MCVSVPQLASRNPLVSATLREVTLRFAFVHCPRDLSLVQWVMARYETVFAPGGAAVDDAPERRLLAEQLHVLAPLLPASRFVQLVDLVCANVCGGPLSAHGLQEASAVVAALAVSLHAGGDVRTIASTALTKSVLPPMLRWFARDALTVRPAELARLIADLLRALCELQSEATVAALPVDVTGSSGLWTPTNLHAVDALIVCLRCALIRAGAVPATLAVEPRCVHLAGPFPPAACALLLECDVWRGAGHGHSGRALWAQRLPTAPARVLTTCRCLCCVPWGRLRTDCHLATAPPG